MRISTVIPNLPSSAHRRGPRARSLVGSTVQTVGGSFAQYQRSCYEVVYRCRPRPLEPHVEEIPRSANQRSESGPGRPGRLLPQWSGKEVTSPSPPPLRTAREDFPSCSSSLSNAPCKTRLFHI